MHYLLLLTLLFLASCSSQKEKLCKQNLKGEYIYRLQNEFFFTPPPPRPITRESYPWENQYVQGLPRITKDFFRCKGSSLNPAHMGEENGEPVRYGDCGGAEKHSLPLRDQKEFIYPILIDLLNYIQISTGKRVVRSSSSLSVGFGVMGFFAMVENIYDLIRTCQRKDS